MRPTVHSISGVGSRGVGAPLYWAGRLPAGPDASSHNVCRTRCTCRAAPSRSETRVAEEAPIGPSVDKALSTAPDFSATPKPPPETEETALGGNLDEHLDIFAADFPIGDEGDGGAGKDEDEKEHPTELIFKLDRRGYGWGEEIIPYVTIERRPIEPKKKRLRNRSKGPNPWEEGSLEQFLVEMGVPNDQVEAVAAAAIAWRVTPGGRPLIDRRRRSRVERNMWAVAEHLTNFCGIMSGPEGIGSLLLQAPQILLAKPTQHDRWHRRVVELASFMHHFGHCNVPEAWSHSPELAMWVKRQRTAKVEGELNQERLQILHALGFEFGEVAVITQEWENWFDALVEWVLKHTENGDEVNWSGFNWFTKGGWKVGELAVWAELQRELRNRNLLPKEAIQRLDAVNFCWKPETTESEVVWMSHFRQLVYISERRRMKRQRRSAYSPGDIMIPSETTTVRSTLDAFTSHRPIAAEGGHKEPQANRLHRQDCKWPKMDRLSGIKLDLRLQRWLLKQRFLWRAGRLPHERVAMFWTAGIDLNDYSRHAWVQLAYETASFVNGFDEKWSKDICHDAQNQEKDPQLSPRLYVKPEDVMAVTKDGDVIEWPVEQKVSSLSDGTSVIVNGINGLHLDASLESDLTLQRKVNGSNGNELAHMPARGGRKQPCADEVRRRLKVRRWVLTQQALFRESRLSEQQIRHMIFLGLGWLLSEMDTYEADKAWVKRYRELSDLVRRHGAISTYLPSELHEWLNRQRGLQRLGMLGNDRVHMLNELGMDWDFRKSEDDLLWEEQLVELLEFKRVNPSSKVPREGEKLGAWLAEQLAKWKRGTLPELRINQLRALGISMHCS